MSDTNLPSVLPFPVGQSDNVAFHQCFFEFYNLPNMVNLCATVFGKW